MQPTARLLALAATLSTASAAVYQGFNYGSTDSSGAPITMSQYQELFSTAKGLVGTSGFTSARLYTMIQGGTTNTPIEAIAAAVQEDTSLLLGLWASGGQEGLDNELAALKSVISSQGTGLGKLVAGISVGSEDLYRESPMGIEAKSGVGASPDTVADFIGQVKDAIKNTPLKGAPVGHVDTWTAWVNGSNQAVIDASDFIGMDAYPYFQNTMSNPISKGKSLFNSAYQQTKSATNGKPVWITETGWPVSGDTSNEAVPSTANAKTFWDEVGCPLFGETNTWWYTLQDASPTTPNPSFGVIGSKVSKTPLYDLSCSNTNNSSSSSSSASGSATASAGSSATSVAVSSVAAKIGSPGVSGAASAASGEATASASGASASAAKGSAAAKSVPAGTAASTGAASAATGSSGSSSSGSSGSVPASGNGTSSSAPSGTGAAGAASTSSPPFLGGAATNAVSVGGILFAAIAGLLVL